MTQDEVFSNVCRYDLLCDDKRTHRLRRVATFHNWMGANGKNKTISVKQKHSLQSSRIEVASYSGNECVGLIFKITCNWGELMKLERVCQPSCIALWVVKICALEKYFIKPQLPRWSLPATSNIFITLILQSPVHTRSEHSNCVSITTGENTVQCRRNP